ncbi:cytidine deaminase [Nocardioides sp.]|uniref:cytidine deaminase n=1 Tax=Nocardioides sp. TaxID=35761 RepID=UPI002BA50FE0|nr:cytidine deaminase [Nocardioides sp.]HXH80688.1 cytidine deaminase [Nocardioides sp.]
MVRPSDAELEELIDSVRTLARGRFPEGDEGAAGMLLADGAILTSTAPAAFNPSVEVCHEVGAYCEAYKRDVKVVASVCLHRQPDDRFLVLSPCGVCLERLAVHGPGVLVGVPAGDDSSMVSWVELRDAHPYYWRRVFADDTSGF